MKPTKDKVLKETLNSIQELHYLACTCSYCMRIKSRTKRILDQLEMAGYHKDDGMTSEVKINFNKRAGDKV